MKTKLKPVEFKQHNVQWFHHHHH